MVDCIYAGNAGLWEWILVEARRIIFALLVDEDDDGCNDNLQILYFFLVILSHFDGYFFIRFQDVCFNILPPTSSSRLEMTGREIS